jgi:hypothetical protein
MPYDNNGNLVTESGARNYAFYGILSPPYALRTISAELIRQAKQNARRCEPT